MRVFNAKRAQTIAISDGDVNFRVISRTKFWKVVLVINMTMFAVAIHPRCGLDFPHRKLPQGL